MSLRLQAGDCRRLALCARTGIRADTHDERYERTTAGEVDREGRHGALAIRDECARRQLARPDSDTDRHKPNPIGPALQRQGITSNEMLSQRRADDMMQYLLSQGVKPHLISAQGFGDTNPVASNDTAQGRAQNRRVELSLAGSNR